MLFTMVKNNFKLMFRSKMIIVMMIIMPILVIAALSSAFHGLLSGAYDVKDVTIGYYFEEDSPVAQFEDEMSDAFKEQNITVKEYAGNDMKQAIKQDNIDVFLYCDKDGCQIGAEDTESIQTKVCLYAMQQFMDEYNLAGLNMGRIMSGENELGKVKIDSESLPYTKTAEASDYYGIIEIIYFLWCGIFFLTAVVQSERKNHLQKRFVISSASGLNLYLGKFIPCELIVVISSAISALIATFLFDIHWGNIPGTIGILLLVSLASTAYGIVLLYIVDNLAVSVILLFGTVWVGGFLGGSFETYMFSSYAERIKMLSPLYWANRTVVEYSTMGHSDYTVGCILYMLGIMAVCMILGSLLMNRKKI